MKKYIYLLLSAFAVLTLTNCQRDKGYDPMFSKNSLQLTLSETGLGSDMATKGSIQAEAGENVVNNLCLLFFEQDANNNGLFVDYVTMEGPLEMNSALNIDLSTHPQLSVSGSYNIIAVANIDDSKFIPGTIQTWMASWTGKRQSVVMMQAMAFVTGGSGNDDNSQAMASDWLLMNGKTVKNANDMQIKIALTRNVVRFDVVNKFSTTHDLVSVSIWNAYGSSSIWNEGIMDYSSSAARIRRYYGVDNRANTTTEDGLDGNGKELCDISGSLYAFENSVVSPSQNDTKTTCLIVGLKKRGTTGVTYYRANIIPENSPQSLKRNKVYRLTLLSVTSPGKASEEEAFTGAGNTLNYTINNWDLDDNGLIVQDGNSILALPTKTAKIGRDAGEFDYSIYTFTTLPTYLPLSIKSQTYDPANGKISASLIGNVLRINAQDMPLSETGERRGVIVLSFAGLEATLTVIQSGDAGVYLKVTLPDGGIPAYAPFAGIGSGYITVNASGPWTAKLYMDGFSIDNPSTLTLTIKSADAFENSKFRIYTYSANPDAQRREAFVLVSLDSDPENYAGVVRVMQSPQGGITVSPNKTMVTFNGTGTGLAPITGNDASTFNVYPNKDDSNVISPWKCEIIQDGANDDRAKFEIYGVTTSPSVETDNKLSVKAVSANNSGRQYQAKLRISLQNDGSVYKEITLVQQSNSLALSQTSFQAISIKGGETTPISVLADASMEWKINVDASGSKASDGRTLVMHDITIVDETGALIALNTPQPMTKKFKVVFPKVLYPNRDIAINANVTVTLVGSSLSKTITVSQTPLTARATICADIFTGYGSIRDAGSLMGYSASWYGPQLKAIGFVINSSVTSNTTFVNAANHYMPAAYDWKEVNDFMNSTDGITTIAGCISGLRANVISANCPLVKFGYAITAPSQSSATLNTSSPVINTRVYKFLTANGKFTVSTSGVVKFLIDGEHLEASTIPASAVSLIVNNNGKTLLSVDPKNALVYVGEDQLFQNDNQPNAKNFMFNLDEYIKLSAQYGSHFTDLLREDLPAVPAPWDNAWGANKFAW